MNPQKTGDMIRALRKDKNMTQLDLAEILNCTDKAVSRWETGKGFPDADMLLALSDIFGVTINEILSGEKFATIKNTGSNVEYDTAEHMIEQIISVSDKNIVNIMNVKDNEIKKINISVIHLVAVCCTQVLIFFVIPDLIMHFKPAAEPVLFLIYGPILNFIAAALIKDKIRWLFPLFTAICMLVPLATVNSEGFLNLWFAAIYGCASTLIMALITAVRFIIKNFSTEE